MTREEAIENLKGLLESNYVDSFEDAENEALKMAIASLKTDEAYQLEYENRDFVEIHKGMTNGEVIQALFDGLVIHDNPAMQKYTIPMTYDFWNAPYQKGGE